MINDTLVSKAKNLGNKTEMSIMLTKNISGMSCSTTQY